MKAASGATATDVRCTGQATRVASGAAIVDGRCVGQATKATSANKEYTT